MLREKITAEYLEQIFRENYSRYYYYALSVVDESEVAKDIIGEMLNDGILGEGTMFNRKVLLVAERESDDFTW